MRNEQDNQNQTNKFLSLFHKRCVAFVNEIGKYGRLIMNDHFSIILMVILAFGVIYYRELLDKIESLNASSLLWALQIGMVLIIAIVVKDRQIWWFTHPSDESFLFPRGKVWISYWQKGLIGMILWLIMILIVSIIIFPVLIKVTLWHSGEWLLFIICQVMIHFLLTIHHWLNAFISPKMTETIRWVLTIFYAVLVIFKNTYVFMVMIIFLMGLLVFAIFRWSKRTKQTIDFEYVVNEENLRIKAFYQWIALFTDVPQLKSQTKRRAYLDPILNFLSSKYNNRYFYYFIRKIFRQVEYSGIWTRVTIFTSVLLLMMNQSMFAFATGMIGYVMTTVQLVPMMFSDQHHVVQRLYPIKSSPISPFKWMLRLVLYLQTVIFSLITRDIMVVLVWIIVIEVIMGIYIPWWYQKNTVKYKGV